MGKDFVNCVPDFCITIDAPLQLEWMISFYKRIDSLDVCLNKRQKGNNFAKGRIIETSILSIKEKKHQELFEAIVGEHYEYILKRFIKAQQEFAELPAAQQPEVMSDISGICMYDMLHYAYEHLEECKLILCCSEGTKFAGLIDEMVEIEVDGTHAYQDVLRQLGRSSPHIDPSLEHILITGMFHTFFELIIHEMPLKDAENYVKEMRAFYTAGWMKIMGQ